MRRKTKIIYFLIISGVVVIIILLFFLSTKTSSDVFYRQIPPFEEISEEEAKKCPYLNENNPIIAKLRDHEKIFNRPNKELEKLSQIPKQFVVRCYEKGYHWEDINQLWDWKLADQEIPDLKTKQRIGVINSLLVLLSWKRADYIGTVCDLVVIVRKISGSGGPTINIDSKLLNDLPMMPNSGNKTKKYFQRIINLFCDEKDINLKQREIFIFHPIGAERFGKEETIAYGRIGGKSGGSSFYLALLSALYEKPISNQVASTGALLVSNKNKKQKINDREIKLAKGTIFPIKYLKEKAFACAEKGINNLVLSKYQSSPNLLLEFRPSKLIGTDNDHKKIYSEEKWVLAENYQQVVDSEVKEKLQVHFAENVKDLREIFFRGKLG